MKWLGRLMARGSELPAARTASTRLALPARTAGVHDPSPLSLVPIYRALDILTTAAAQLSLTLERGGQIVTGRLPAHILRPDPEMDRSAWIEQAVISLAMTGNLFLLRLKDISGAVIGARILPADEVHIRRDPQTRVVVYHHKNRAYTAAEINHQTLMRLPGHDRGLGPLQAARAEIRSAQQLREFSAGWFDSSGQPAGLITSKGMKTLDEARAIRDAWNDAAADADNPTRVRVIGGDSHYQPLMISPKDAQWLEVRAYTTTEFARLFGVPASLMLASTDGTSLTYSNVIDEWLGFVRFTLMKYIRKIEEALTALAPLGQKVRFNVESLLRADTRGRYEAYTLAINAGWMTTDEVRKIEGLEA